MMSLHSLYGSLDEEDLLFLNTCNLLTVVAISTNILHFTSQHNTIKNHIYSSSILVLKGSRDLSFPQSYVVIPLAVATRNLFHNFLSFRSLLPFNILVCLVFLL